MSLAGTEESGAREKPSDPITMYVGAPSVPGSSAQHRHVTTRVPNIYNGLPSLLEYNSLKRLIQEGNQTSFTTASTLLDQPVYYCLKSAAPKSAGTSTPSPATSPTAGAAAQVHDFSAKSKETQRVVYPFDGSSVAATTAGLSRRVVWSKGDLVSALHASIDPIAVDQFITWKKSKFNGVYGRDGAQSPSQDLDDVQSIATTAVDPKESMKDNDSRYARSSSMIAPPGHAPSPTISESRSIRLHDDPSAKDPSDLVAEHFTALPRFSTTFDDNVAFTAHVRSLIAPSPEGDGMLPHVKQAACIDLTVSGKASIIQFNSTTQTISMSISDQASAPNDTMIQVFDRKLNKVVPITDIESVRRLNPKTGTVTRYFRSGKILQLLYATGGVSTAYSSSGDGNWESWMHTKSDGTRIAKVINPDPVPSASSAEVKTYRLEELPKVEVRSTIDRESRGHITSRSDGVITVRYTARPERETGENVEELQHTTVVLHADGSKIISFDSLNPRMVTPVPSAFVEGVGVRRFRCEHPSFPSIDLFRPGGEDGSLRVDGGSDFLMEFNDGSMLRHAVVHDGSRQSSFHRPSESTIRVDHYRQLIFVEPSSVQFKERTPASIACCEGIGVFDPLNGSFRLVDYKQHVTEVINILGGILGIQHDVAASFKPSTIDDILLALAPSGMDPHTRPKAVHSQTLAKAKAAHEMATNALEIGYQLPHFCYPCCLYRLREVVAPFIQQVKLVVGKNTSGAKLAGAQSQWVDREIIPHIFIQRRDGRCTELLCQHEITPLVHLAAKNPTVTVNSSSFSGEPGIEQIAFMTSTPGSIAQGAASALAKSQKGGLSMSRTQQVFSSSFTRSFDASYFASGGALGATSSSRAAGGVEGLSWLPKSLLPTRAPREMKRLTNFDIAVRQAPMQCSVLRTFLRYTPMTDGVKRTVVRGFVKSQRHKQQMLEYGKGLINEDPRTDMDKSVAYSLAVKHRQRLQELHQTLTGEADPATSAMGGPPRQLTEEELAEINANQPVDALNPAQASPKPPQKNVHVSPSRIDKQHIFPSVESLEFGTLPQRFRYSLTLTLRNTSTNALMFQVRRADLKDTIVTIQNAKGLISPMNTSVVIIIASIGPNVARGVDVERKLFIDCQGTRRPLVVPVRMRIATEEEDFAFKLRPNIKVLGPV